MNTNDEVLNIIISLIKGLKAGGNLSTNNFDLKSCKYLLNQTIRQLSLSPDHYLISVAAKQKWEELQTGKDIETCFYRETITCNSNQPVEVLKYKGNATKNFTTVKLSKGDHFTYREIFHNEHIVPVEKIITQLKELPNLNLKSVKQVIDRIYICRVLKCENAALQSKHKRDGDKDDIIKNLYNTHNIFIAE